MIDAHKQIKLPTHADLRRAKRMQRWRNPYLLWGLLSYGLICVMVLVYLGREPVFSSNMALVLPGSGSSSSFQIDNVGQAKSDTKSPFAGASFNPRVNYKEMLKSREVIAHAAEHLNMSEKGFGQPKIKLTEQTSIIEVQVKAGNGAMAKEKAWALYNAFQMHLDALRADEALRRDQSVMSVLAQYQDRLHQTRESLVRFQEQSLLIDEMQVTQMMSTLTQVRSEMLFAEAERNRQQNFVNQLSFDLGVSPGLAGQAFSLQTDTQFRSLLKELDHSAQQYSEYRSTWGKNHPKVKASQKRLEFAQQATFDRSATLLGSVNAKVLHTVNLDNSPDRSRLFGQLLDAYASLQGTDARITELEASASLLDDKLRILARESKELEALKREYDLAEAVYTSAAARLEAGKADVFASYPVIQLLTSPNTPIQQTSPSTMVAVAGGLAGFFFVTVALLIIWQRGYLIARLLQHSPD